MVAHFDASVRVDAGFYFRDAEVQSNREGVSLQFIPDTGDGCSIDEFSGWTVTNRPLAAMPNWRSAEHADRHKGCNLMAAMGLQSHLRLPERNWNVRHGGGLDGGNKPADQAAAPWLCNHAECVDHWAGRVAREGNGSAHFDRPEPAMHGPCHSAPGAAISCNEYSKIAVPKRSLC